MLYKELLLHMNFWNEKLNKFKAIHWIIRFPIFWLCCLKNTLFSSNQTRAAATPTTTAAAATTMWSTKKWLPRTVKSLLVWTDWTDIIAAARVAAAVAVAVGAVAAVEDVAAGSDCTKRSTQTTLTQMPRAESFVCTDVQYIQMAMAAYGNIPRAHSMPLCSRSGSSNIKSTAGTATTAVAAATGTTATSTAGQHLGKQQLQQQ